MPFERQSAKSWTRVLWVCAAAVSGTLVSVDRVAAGPDLKWQVDQHGGFALVGNSLAQECNDRDKSPAIPAPVVGSVAECPDTGSNAPDIYYRVDDPSTDNIRVDRSTTANNARTTAVLELPQNATVTHARLYWGAYAHDETPNSRVHFGRHSSGLDCQLTPERMWTAREHPDGSGRFWYQAATDVTEMVKSEGAGAYRVGDFSTYAGSEFAGYLAWYMVVFYEQADEPQRNLALFEGLDLVAPNNPLSVTLSGFSVSSAGVNEAKLGVAAFDGDAVASGDSLSFDGTVLSDDQNPADNFFNATRSRNGKPVSVKGELPQLTGEPRSLNNLDLDVVDITGLVKPGQTSVNITGASSQDTFLLSTFVTAVAGKGTPAAPPPPSDPTPPPPEPTADGTRICSLDSDCQAPNPYCDFGHQPQVCVPCVTSRHCTDVAAPDCSPERHVCECAADDGNCQTDSDNDGISDVGERGIGTDPNDSDTDDDGTPDGDEVNPNVDTDGDGLKNPFDPDSDNDGLFDGTEQGFDCSLAGTDTSRQRCTPDADQSTTRTNPVQPDTDFGGVSDGDEDANRNGRQDATETDPTPGHGADDRVPDRNDASVGFTCSVDLDCGDARSGLICRDGTCGYGCRGTDGNGCPSSLTCSSRNAAAGSCQTNPPLYASDLDGGTDEEPRRGADASAPPSLPLKLYGGGGDCHVVRAAGTTGGFGGHVYALLVLGWFMRRRIKR